MNKISIIIPTYNVEKYVLRCLSSIVDQTYKNIEIIVVDDGSTDKTFDLVNEFLSNSKSEYQLLRQSNCGVSVARNLGLQRANGEFIYIIDSDDYIEKTFLEKLLQSIIVNNSEAAFCASDAINEFQEVISVANNDIKTVLFDRDKLIKTFIMRNLDICTGNILYKSTNIKRHNIKYNENCFNGEDQEFNLKVLFNCKKISFVQENLFHYFVRGNSVTKTYDKKLMSVTTAMKNVANYFIAQGNHDLFNMINSYKMQKDFFYNLDMIIINNYNENKEFIRNDLCKNKQLIKDLKTYKIIKYNAREIKYKLKINFFCYLPALYIRYKIVFNKIIRVKKSILCFGIIGLRKD